MTAPEEPTDPMLYLGVLIGFACVLYLQPFVGGLFVLAWLWDMRQP